MFRFVNFYVLLMYVRNERRVGQFPLKERNCTIHLRQQK
jgi:hypothetical protein